MKKTLISVVSAAAMLVAGADAATIYATDIDWDNNGTVGTANDRDNELNALGAPDGKFLALGLTNPDGSNPGFAVFSFGGQTMTGETRVWEVTFNCTATNDGSCTYPESVAVYYGTDYNFGSHDFSDLSDFTFAGELFNADGQGGASIIIPGTFTYLALIDTTASNYPGGPSTDGFDIDSVSASQVPVPGAALLAGPLFAAAAMRRRKARR